MKSPAHALVAKLRGTLGAPVDFDTFLGKFSERERQNITRHLTAYEAKFGEEAAKRWRHFACLLMTLTPNPAKLAGQLALQFYIPDGKYRRQVFALQPGTDGSLTIYASNAIAEGVRTGIVLKPKPTDEPGIYRLPDSNQSLPIEAFDGQTPDPAPIYKAMTGWNRKAIGMTLPVHATAAQVQAVEDLCVLSSAQWTTAAPQQA